MVKPFLTREDFEHLRKVTFNIMNSNCYIYDWERASQVRHYWEDFVDTSIEELDTVDFENLFFNDTIVHLNKVKIEGEYVEVIEITQVYQIASKESDYLLLEDNKKINKEDIVCYMGDLLTNNYGYMIRTY